MSQPRTKKPGNTPTASSKKTVAKKRSICPIACTLDIIGDKWTLLVVRDLFAGKSHYHEFASSPERIATNILADRLDRLTNAGIINQSKSTQRVGSTAYALTPLGSSLFPLLVAMRDWGLANIAGTQARVAVPTPAST
jgi:DNA-binding HxlR family transcriptional regulator